MKMDIIVVYIPRYKKGHEVNFVPPVTGIHLAALTPRTHDIRVFHQQLQKIDLDSNADLIAISFFSGFAPAAYELADHFRTTSSWSRLAIIVHEWILWSQMHARQFASRYG